MKLGPRFCRTCGSRILVRHACHSCSSDPLKGSDYCYDCGAPTPQGTRCIRCGAKYYNKFPVIFSILIFFTFIAVAAAVVFYILNTERPVQLAANQPPQTVSQPENMKADSVVSVVRDTTVKRADTTKPIEINGFSAEELKTYKIRCSYFTKKQKNEILFFTNNSSGYLKVNDKIYELARKQRGSDRALYSDGTYEVNITIDGLSGSSKEWLASCTLTVKTVDQKQSVRNKVYSSCIEF